MPIWLAIVIAIFVILIAAGVGYGLLVIERIHKRVSGIDEKIASAMGRLESEGIEKYSFGLLVERAARLLSLAEEGRIPSLRTDDWVPSMSDRERAGKALEERGETDRHIGPYLGPK